MKRNRFILLLLLVIGGLSASTGTSGSQQVPAAAATPACQHTLAPTGAGTDEATPTATQTDEPNRHLSERLVTALDAFARLVMVM